MMNICLIMPNVFPVPATKGGATEMLITNLLRENERKGLIKFTCISVYDKEAESISQEYKYTDFIYIKQKRKNLDLTFETQDEAFKLYMDEIYKKIKDKQFDFIIIEGGEISGYNYLLEKLPNQRCLVHIHGNVIGDNKINDKIYEKFIAISKYTFEIILEDKKIDRNKIELLYNAIDLKNFQRNITYQEKLQLRAKYGIAQDDVVIVYAGRTIPVKGVKELIESFKKLNNLQKCKLLIVGSANYGEQVKTDYDYEIEELAKDIKDKIKFTGYIDNEELYKIHNISDIAIVPSMWEELFGLVVVEFMSSGLPLIVTKSGGIPEIVDDNCAYVIDKDENLIDNMAAKIDYLVQNENIRKNMGIKGRERAQKFGIEQYMINFYELMKKLK